MNTKKMALASTAVVFAVLALLLAYPAMAASNGVPQDLTEQQLLHASRAGAQSFQLSPGQTITLTSVAGGYWVVGDRAVNGTASGTLTLQVTGALSGGDIITVTGGSLDINGTTYTITSGSAELGPHGSIMVGQGQAGNAWFLFSGRNIGRFGSSSYGVLRVDLKDGGSEFAARMLVTISV